MTGLLHVKSTILRVLPTPTRRWRVELPTDTQPTQFVTKGQAISFAIVWADLHQPCEVEVYDISESVERIIRMPDGKHRHTHISDRRTMQIEIDFPDRRKHKRRLYA